MSIAAAACLAAVLLAATGEDDAPPPDRAALRRDALTELAESGPRAALPALDAWIEALPDDLEPRRLRAAARMDTGALDAALRDCDHVLSAAAEDVRMTLVRAEVRFRLGRFPASVEDYDRAIELAPAIAPRLWQRGIALYYAEDYARGSAQFESYQDFDASDVENAVWRWLCQAKESGPEVASEKMLRIRGDSRVPMREIWRLYKGEIRPEHVLTRVRAGDPPPDELDRRLFYARLYIGLWHDAHGDSAEALRWIDRSTDTRLREPPHFMDEVGRVHRDVLIAAALAEAPDAPENTEESSEEASGGDAPADDADDEPDSQRSGGGTSQSDQ